MRGRNVLFLFDNFALDCERRELRADGMAVPVEPQVFDLLVYLVENRDRVVSKDDLIASVWGGRIVSESTLTSRINATRKAIGDSGKDQRLIRTSARKGFRFVGDIPQDPRPPVDDVNGAATGRGGYLLTLIRHSSSTVLRSRLSDLRTCRMTERWN